MKTRTKTFDCVEFKNQAQRRLMKEYEARRAEFRSYEEFITVTAATDPKVRALRESLGLPSPSKP